MPYTDVVPPVFDTRAALTGASSDVSSGASSDRRWLIGRLAFVALAYFAGTQVGSIFRSPEVPQSVLWLPNSIVLAALLVSPVRQWPLILLVVLPAQLLAAVRGGALAQMGPLYLTNCADAVLGATLWRLASDGERRIEGLRQMVAFVLLAATLPTLLLSFVDAGITVATGWDGDYWLAFATRARANVLTNILLAPAVLAIVDSGARASLDELRTRGVEIALVVTGLLLTTWLASRDAIGAVGAGAFTYLPMIFLIWAAVRFGVGFTGSALLVLAYFTTWIAIHAPSHDGSQVEIPRLQFQLLAIAVPLLCLSAVVKERERAARALGDSQRALHESLAEVHSLAGRLLTAAETERTRIARELHDDVSQQIAAIGIGLGTLRNRLDENSPLSPYVTTLQRQAQGASEDLRTLSHELHPATLRHAGLVLALRGLIAQYARTESLRVEFAVTGDVEVPNDVGLCLYRVTQEALRNVARHACANVAWVTLAARPRDVELLISDRGSGFDPARARAHGGLGLTSISERVRLVGGAVAVHTSPGRGTLIAITIPTGDRDDADHDTARG